MKLALIVVLLASVAVAGIAGSGVMSASPTSTAQPSASEQKCLDFADMAMGAAAAAKRGVSESEIIKTARKLDSEQNAGGAVVIATRQALTTGAPPDVARAMVYAKCQMGEYDAGRLAVK